MEHGKSEPHDLRYAVTHHLYSSLILESSASSLILIIMAQFTPINVDPNANGGYFSMQLAGGEDELDVFAVFGLRADGPALDHHACLYIHQY